jgi:hypothetical protein
VDGNQLPPGVDPLYDPDPDSIGLGSDPGCVDPAPPRFPGIDGEPLPIPPEGGFPFPEADPIGIGIGAGHPPLIGQGGDGCDPPRIGVKGGPRPEVDPFPMGDPYPPVPTQTEPPGIPPEPEWDPNLSPDEINERLGRVS